MGCKTALGLLIAFGLVMPACVHGDERIKLLGDKYPKIMGMNIGKKNYDDPSYQHSLSKLDLVILGFYRGWDRDRKVHARDVVRNLKRSNPKIIVGQYTCLNEAQDDETDIAKADIRGKITSEKWWLRNGQGKRVQWTRQYNAWEVNFTYFARPDSSGKRYSEWIAERDYHVFFADVPEFDIWYFDNVFLKPRVSNADWDGDGIDEQGADEHIQKAFRRGYTAHWAHARKLAPRHLFIGNSDNDLSALEFRNRLQGAFLEGLMGYSWSLETWAGWKPMMKRYHSVFENLSNPKMVGFHVIGNLQDYQLLRYALSSCLLNDGFFCFSDIKSEYSSVPWFDEYDVDLGRPMESPTQKPWREQIYRRLYQKGMVLVNPGNSPARVRIEPGYRRLLGTQDRLTNDGKKVDNVFLNSKDGAILLKDE